MSVIPCHRGGHLCNWPKEKGVAATKMRKQIEKAERKAKREERE